MLTTGKNTIKVPLYAISLLGTYTVEFDLPLSKYMFLYNAYVT